MFSVPFLCPEYFDITDGELIKKALLYNHRESLPVSVQSAPPYAAAVAATAAATSVNISLTLLLHRTPFISQPCFIRVSISPPSKDRTPPLTNGNHKTQLITESKKKKG